MRKEDIKTIMHTGHTESKKENNKKNLAHKFVSVDGNIKLKRDHKVEDVERHYLVNKFNTSL